MQRLAMSAMDVEVAFHMLAAVTAVGEKVVAHLAIDGKQCHAHAGKRVLLQKWVSQCPVQPQTYVEITALTGSRRNWLCDLLMAIFMVLNTSSACVHQEMDSLSHMFGIHSLASNWMEGGGPLCELCHPPG